MLPFVEDDCNNDQSFIAKVCEEHKEYQQQHKIDNDNKMIFEDKKIIENNVDDNALLSDSECSGYQGNLNLKPQFYNYCTKFNVGCKLNLVKIVCCVKNTEYNPSRFPGLIMRILEPRATALIFESGRIVTCGSKTKRHAKNASILFAKIIKKVGFDVRFRGFKVTTMLAKFDVKFPIRIEGIFFKNMKRAFYEPEIFPGVVYRMKNPKLCCLIFVSGRIIMAGVKQEQDSYLALKKLYPKLLEFKKIGFKIPLSEHEEEDDESESESEDDENSEATSVSNLLLSELSLRGISFNSKSY